MNKKEKNNLSKKDKVILFLAKRLKKQTKFDILYEIIWGENNGKTFRNKWKRS